MRTRVEIFKNNKWIKLVLREDKIQYNTLSNKIGNFEQRRINHSNTFSLPYVSENIIALDINVFSPALMAEALNKKYISRYFIDDKLAQKGFLVINNTVRGEINVNFIDEALVITDEWGKVTFKQLLLNLAKAPESFEKSVISPDFMENINILKDFETDKSKIVENAPSCICSGDDLTIQDKEVYILRYPNPLNSIGDKFNIDNEGVRKLDSFNPFQSRPIFSIFGFIYIICQAFGYRLRLDSSVDFELLRDTYLTSKGIDEGTPPKDLTVSSITPTIDLVKPQNWVYDKNGPFTGDNEGDYETFFLYPDTTVVIDSFGKKTGVDSVSPQEIDSTYYPSSTLQRNAFGTILPPIRRTDLRVQKCIVKIEESPFLGDVIWTAADTGRAPNNRFQFRSFVAKSVWLNSSNKAFEVDFDTEVVISGRNYTVTGSKEQLNNTPPGAVSFVGLFLRVVARHTATYWNDEPRTKNLHFVEKVLPSGKIFFDSYGQYLTNHTNLLEMAPDTSVKELLSNVLQQQGLLLTFERDSEGTQNIVKLFTYGAYRNRVTETRSGIPNRYYDWSKYHQRLVPPLFNTDYGSSYGEVNEISLTNPFPGNVGRIQILTNITEKGFQTKLIPLAKNQTKSLEDVSAVNLILNTDPYFEYTLKNQGLVKCSFDEYLPGVRKQFNAELETSTINCSSLPLVSNVIYSDDFLPIGIKEWYYLIDVAVRGQATFLLPLLVIKTFDISLPIYVESLGGFYIVEQIGEYSDNLTPVKVDLIKLPL